MSFEKLLQRSGPVTLTDRERRKVHVLVVEPEAAVRNSMRQMLSVLGFGQVSDSPDHVQALKKFEERPFTHVIFEAKRTTMPAKEFLSRVLELCETTIAIPSSWEPNVDDVFDLLITGARGYLVKPITESSLDDALVMSTKGEPISDAILYAKNRNDALAALAITALDKAAATVRQAAQFETAKREVPRRLQGLKRAIDIGHTFAEGGTPAFIEAVVSLCLERANGPATRLGRLRKRLESKKQHAQDDQAEKVEETQLPAEETAASS